MTHEQAELIQKLAMSLDCCMEMVETKAAKERLAGRGQALRPITWQDRVQSFGKLIDQARTELNDAGKPTFF